MALVAPLAGVAFVLLAACDGDGEPSPPPGTTTVTPSASPTSASTPEPTPTTSAEATVLEAYERYWDVYADALFRLDGTRLSDVMTGSRLERALGEIETLQAEGQAVRIVVEKEPVVAAIDAEQATIIDDYENASYLIDPATKEPIADRGEPNRLRDVFMLVREDGVWKVHDSVRQESSS